MLVTLLVGLGAAASPLRAQLSNSRLVQEPGAVYLEDLLDAPLKVKITTPAAVYSNLSADRWLGNLVAGREAELLAISDKAYRVRARATQGQVAGWVSKSAVEGVDAEMEKKLIRFYDRQVLVQDLIANRQVAMGMTVAEVEASLGKPDTRSSKVDQQGRKDTLGYITYERVPQTSVTYDRFGRPFQSITYIKVPTGKLSLNFENDLVSSIEESEGVEFSGGGGGIRIVPPPIVIF
jgi:hypothetical protein